MGKLGFTEIIVLIFLLAIYFIPTIVAFSRNKNNRTAIFVLNLFLGWTLVGWIVSLVWACISDKPQTIVMNNSFSENKPIGKTEDKLESLQKLKELLDSGALTQAEFEEQKAKILAI